MGKDNIRYSVFASQDIVSKLKNGINPLPERIFEYWSFNLRREWEDWITGDVYIYEPSEMESFGKPRGISHECLIRKDGTNYCREIAEDSVDRSKDKYTIQDIKRPSGERVTREEYLDEMSRLSLKQNDRDVQQAMNTILKMDTTKNNKLEVINELRSHRYYEVSMSCMRSIKLDTDANTLVKNAIELEKEASESHDRKLLDIAGRLYIDSEILKKQSDIEFQRAILLDFFANVKDNGDKFRSKLSSLMAAHYFTNLKDTDYEEMFGYLDVVFLKKGLNDVIEFLLKMKDARIEYSDTCLTRINSQTEIPELVPGVTSFSYTTIGEDKMYLELDQTRIILYRSPNVKELKKAKWHEFSHVLLQPFTGPVDEGTLEEKTDHYTDELLGNSGVHARKLKI